MATIEESLYYPLILLLVGAGVSGVLVTWITNRWQDRRKELEIQVNLVSKITEVYGSLSAKVVVSIERRKPIFNINEAVEKFLGDGDVVQTLLRSYYPSEANITKRWYDFASSYFAFADATSLYFVKAPTNNNEKEKLKCQLKRQLNEVKKYFSDYKNDVENYFADNKEIKITWDSLMPYDDELWVKINNRTLPMPRDNELLVEINNLYGYQVSKIISDVLKIQTRWHCSCRRETKEKQ